MAPGARAGGPGVLRGELTCPRCGNDTLHAVSDGFQTNFSCHECGTCWHYSLGWMDPVPGAGAAGDPGAGRPAPDPGRSGAAASRAQRTA